MSNTTLPTLHTERCTIRPWQPADLEALPDIADTQDISWNTSYRFPHPFTADKAACYLVRHIKGCGDDHWSFAVEENGELIGGCACYRGQDIHAHTAELGYWLTPSHWGKGLGTEIVNRMVEFMTAETDVEQLSASCFGWNPASSHVLEKCGFEHEGTRRGVVKKWGKRTDLVVFGKLLR